VTRRAARFAAVLAIVTLAACGSASTRSLPYASSDSPEAGTYRRVCDGPSMPAHSRCFAIARTDAGAHVDAASLEAGTACNGRPGCFGPADLQAAYNIAAAATSGGKNATVAVVDAWGYPDAARDLAAYRKAFKLPPCGDGCFRVVNEEGTGKLPIIGLDWQNEQALDIDMVSAICPHCKILLVEANSDADRDLDAAVDTAARLGADAISNSYGCEEEQNDCPTVAANAHYDHRGVVITASAGDGGAGAYQPCSFATVICVGGTSLRPSNAARGYTEIVWNGLVKHLCDGGRFPCATGSGCSSVVAKPVWQTDEGCARRSESDLSAVADPYTGVVIACTPCTGGPFLQGEGGTSASAPIVAAMYALAGNARSQTPATLWKRQGNGFNDVTDGTNENSAAGTFLCPRSYAYICTARPGYDGPSGWGTPNGLSGL
jgi:subtilase family serine protease